MRILVVADEESKSLWDYYSPEKLKGIDLIISCGDLNAAYLEFLVTMCPCPVMYVPGNHDDRYKEHPPEGCECIDGYIGEFNGVRILGLGGSMKYKRGAFMYTEKEMRKRIARMKGQIIKSGGFDILVTHAPARGYGDMDDLPHQGFDCFNELMDICHPRYMLHGHVHANYGRKFSRTSEHPSGTVIVNGFEKYIIEYDFPPVVQDRKELLKKMLGAFK